MVQIKIKGINNTYHVFATYDDSDAFFILLKERLNHCLGNKTRHFEAFFHVSMRNEQEWKRLFAICEECHTIICGINQKEIHKTTKILETDLRGGEHHIFHEPIILLGNIHKQAYVTTSESLYIIGSVQGSIDILHEDCIISASSLHANVRICDSGYQNLTSFSPCKVYYKQRKAEMKKYKEELQWEKL